VRNYWFICVTSLKSASLAPKCVTWLNSYVWHDSIRTCDMTQSCVWHDSISMCDLTQFICVTWLNYMCEMTHSCMWQAFGLPASHLNAWHDSILMCKVTHSCVWHDSCIYVIRINHMCDMAQFICVTWLICTCDMTHAYMWYGLFLCVHMNGSYHNYEWNL